MHTKVLSLAGPIILSNVTVPLVGAVDTAVVGHLDDSTLIGAVAFGSLIFSFLYWGFGFLRFGTSGFSAQAFGNNDSLEAYFTLSRACLIGLALGVGLIVIHPLLRGTVLFLLQGSEMVESSTAIYFNIRIWSAPAVLILYAVLGYLIAAQDMRAEFYSQLLLNGLNITLDVLFVSVFDLAIEGVALATVISEFAAVIFGLWLISQRTGYRLRVTLTSRLLNRNDVKQLLKANINIFIRTLCLMFGFAWFTNRSAQLGDVYLAANAVLLHLQTIAAYAMDGFATAAEALVGRAIGARDKQNLISAMRITTLWALIIASLLSFVYLMVGIDLIGLMTNQADVLSTAQQYLPWLVVAPVISVWSFQLDGIFIGATRTREMRNAMIVSLAVYLAVLEGLTAFAHNDGLWSSLLCLFVLRAITLWLYLPRITVATKA